MAKQSGIGISTDMQECVDECHHCRKMCLATARHSLELGGKHADPTHVGLLLDCAEICQISENFMLRRSERHQLTCRVCADICRLCAEACERMGRDDELMHQCAEECRKCQQSCERMAA
ncbi:MAG TPA: four-helix bundle copper-binding protein [Gemmatimonadales bacterium]|nr:four-helix bundle copper-binding protein [Gemmatimonadales bacterium]